MEKIQEEILAQEAEIYIEQFKVKMKRIADETLSQLYINLVHHIETDAWQNYRNDLRSVLSSQYARDEWLRDDHVWAREFRARIVQEHRDALIDGLNQDLEKQVKHLQEKLNCRRDY